MLAPIGIPAAPMCARGFSEDPVPALLPPFPADVLDPVGFATPLPVPVLKPSMPLVIELNVPLPLALIAGVATEEEEEEVDSGL